MNGRLGGGNHVDARSAGPRVGVCGSVGEDDSGRSRKRGEELIYLSKVILSINSFFIVLLFSACMYLMNRGIGIRE